MKKTSLFFLLCVFLISFLGIVKCQNAYYDGVKIQAFEKFLTDHCNVGSTTYTIDNLDELLETYNITLDGTGINQLHAIQGFIKNEFDPSISVNNLNIGLLSSLKDSLCNRLAIPVEDITPEQDSAAGDQHQAKESDQSGTVNSQPNKKTKRKKETKGESVTVSKTDNTLDEIIEIALLTQKDKLNGLKDDIANVPGLQELLPKTTEFFIGFIDGAVQTQTLVQDFKEAINDDSKHIPDHLEKAILVIESSTNQDRSKYLPYLHVCGQIILSLSNGDHFSDILHHVVETQVRRNSPEDVKLLRLLDCISQNLLETGSGKSWISFKEFRSNQITAKYFEGLIYQRNRQLFTDFGINLSLQNWQSLSVCMNQFCRISDDLQAQSEYSKSSSNPEAKQIIFQKYVQSAFNIIQLGARIRYFNDNEAYNSSPLVTTTIPIGKDLFDSYKAVTVKDYNTMVVKIVDLLDRIKKDESDESFNSIKDNLEKYGGIIAMICTPPKHH